MPYHYHYSLLLTNKISALVILVSIERSNLDLTDVFYCDKEKNKNSGKCKQGNKSKSLMMISWISDRGGFQQFIALLFFILLLLVFFLSLSDTNLSLSSTNFYLLMAKHFSPKHDSRTS